MENMRAKKSIKEQISNINNNNFNNMEAIESIQLLLTSNNNGTVKDPEISKKISELRQRMDETNRIAKDIASMLK